MAIRERLASLIAGKQYIPAPESEALISRAAEEGARLARQEAIDELNRVLGSNEAEKYGMAGVPVPGPPTWGNTPHPLFAWDNPWNYAIPQSPKQRPGQKVTIQTLRDVADTYPVLRACIQHKKRVLSQVPIEVVAKDTSDKSPSTVKAKKTAQGFFEAQGTLGEPWERRSHFESKMIEDLDVIGAAAIYFEYNRGGKMIQALNIDSSTIRPRVDAWGWPGPGEDAYEQWVLGMKVTSFTPREMRYDGLFPISYSPYPKSPVEYLIGTVNTALRAFDWNLKWLTDGNSPDRIIALPESWTPGQIREFAEYWDSTLAGNIAARQKTKFVPAGGSQVGTPTRKDQEFSELELWLLRITCAIEGVTPASIGFAGEQYKVSQEASMKTTTTYGVGVLLDFRKSIYDDMLVRMGYDDLEVKNVSVEEEAARDRAERLTMMVSKSILTPNEARAEEGLDPLPGGDELLMQGAMVPLSAAVAGYNAVAPSVSQNNPDEPGSVTPAEVPLETRGELAQWRRKALRRVKDNRKAACEFEGDHIPGPLSAWIYEELTRAEGAADVDRLFRLVENALAEVK